MATDSVDLQAEILARMASLAQTEQKYNKLIKRIRNTVESWDSEVTIDDQKKMAFEICVNEAEKLGPLPLKNMGRG